ncbi:MAG: hypothetical protein KME31_26900 [Tolypothrix carrinoi HA7290-LM1]|nr:hypothetical protein [Tolypothrix carrinoi HA7290-LM1]
MFNGQLFNGNKAKFLCMPHAPCPIPHCPINISFKTKIWKSCDYEECEILHFF